MSENDEWLKEVAAPEPRKPKTESLQRRAEAIVRLHRVTFGTFKDKRVIYADETIPKKDYDTLAEAMREGLI